MITSTVVQPNTDPQSMTIYGNDFGSQAPSVYLNSIPLIVTSNTDTSLTVDLPAGNNTLSPGTYILQVINYGVDVSKASSKNSTSFIATIGTVGPQGPVGPMGNTGLTGPAGPPGATGATGPQGVAGPVGQQGPAGPVGATGPAGLTWRGPWASGTSYATNDSVGYNGSSYIALTASTGVNPDSDQSKWQLMAQAGATGTTGTQGPQGLTGPMGPMGPVGPQGLTGPQGPAGPVSLPTVYSKTIGVGPVLPSQVVTPIAALSVPAGSYFVTGSVDLYEPNGTMLAANCTITAVNSGQRLASTSPVLQGPPGPSGVGGTLAAAVSMTGTVTVTSPDTIQLSCQSGFAETFQSYFISLTAITANVITQ